MGKSINTRKKVRMYNCINIGSSCLFKIKKFDILLSNFFIFYKLLKALLLDKIPLIKTFIYKKT